MNKEDLNDELEPEYDLTTLKVRKVGEGRKLLQQSEIRLDVDVARMFPTAAAVNEALRFLMRIAKENQVETESGAVNSEA